MSVPATEMSAPESGRALTVAEPFGLAMCTAMVGAGSMCVVPWRSLALGLVWDVAMDTALAVGPVVCEGVVEGSTGLRDLQTLAKWPTLLQVWQSTRNAGHCLRPPGWNAEPQPGHL